MNPFAHAVVPSPMDPVSMLGPGLPGRDPGGAPAPEAPLRVAAVSEHRAGGAASERVDASERSADRDAPGGRPSILITYPFPLGTKAAGGSRTTPEVARHLGQLGVDVTILAVSTNALDRRYPRSAPPDSELGFHLDEALAPDGVRIVRIDQHPLHYQFDPHRVRAAVGRLLRERPIDLVMAHYNEAGCLLPLLRRRGIPLTFLATWQTYSYLDREYRGWWGKLKKWAEVKYTIQPHREADLIFAISEFTKGELVQILGVRPERVVVTPLGVRPTFTTVPRARPEEITNLLFFGRVVPEKGILDAIEALGLLVGRGVDRWRLRIVGQGRHDLVRAAAERLGLTDRIELSGPTDDAGLRRELEWAHLGVLPSHCESFGLAIAEAQGAGIPVVAFAAGSVPEVVEAGKSGWLAPLRDIDGLARCLEEALGDPERTYEMGLYARERVRRLFDWKRTAGLILEYARTVL